jgi:hypothetical protein
MSAQTGGTGGNRLGNIQIVVDFGFPFHMGVSSLVVEKLHVLRNVYRTDPPTLAWQSQFIPPIKKAVFLTARTDWRFL